MGELFERHGGELAAAIVEPIAQGAGGMWFYSPACLGLLRRLCDEHGVLLVFDEIATGFGRTGTMFAYEQADVVPDIVTLSKALTGGTLPLAATVASSDVYDAFLSDDFGHALMHGPTYAGNALACAAANASLDLFAAEPRLAQAAAIKERLRAGLEPCRTLDGVSDVRVLGAIGVVELDRPPNHDRLRAAFVERGTWVRTFGQVVYLMPPLVIGDEDLETLLQAVRAVVAAHA